MGTVRSISTKVCENCSSKGKFLHENSCVNKSPKGYLRDKLSRLCSFDISLVKCSDGCSQRGICSDIVNKCICDLGFYGDYCEYHKSENFKNNNSSEYSGQMRYTQSSKSY